MLASIHSTKKTYSVHFFVYKRIHKNSEQKLLTQVKYSDLFGTLQEQKDVTGIFLILLGIRTRLLEKDVEPAYEGSNSRPIC